MILQQHEKRGDPVKPVRHQEALLRERSEKLPGQGKFRFTFFADGCRQRIMNAKLHQQDHPDFGKGRLHATRCGLAQGAEYLRCVADRELSAIHGHEPPLLIESLRMLLRRRLWAKRRLHQGGEYLPRQALPAFQEAGFGQWFAE